MTKRFRSDVQNKIRPYRSFLCRPTKANVVQTRRSVCGTGTQTHVARPLTLTRKILVQQRIAVKFTRLRVKPGSYFCFLGQKKQINMFLFGEKHNASCYCFLFLRMNARQFLARGQETALWGRKHWKKHRLKSFNFEGQETWYSCSYIAHTLLVCFFISLIKNVKKLRASRTKKQKHVSVTWGMFLCFLCFFAPRNEVWTRLY